MGGLWKHFDPGAIMGAHVLVGKNRPVVVTTDLLRFTKITFLVVQGKSLVKGEDLMAKHPALERGGVGYFYFNFSFSNQMVL